jgi:hypothetical protein
MRETRLSGSEGGATLIPSSLPLSIVQSLRDKPFRVLIFLPSFQREKTAPSIQLFYRAAIS